MSHSRNDYHRNRFRDYEDEYDYRGSARDRSSHRKDKRITNALRSKDIDTLSYLDEEEDF